MSRKKSILLSGVYITRAGRLSCTSLLGMLHWPRLGRLLVLVPDKWQLMMRTLTTPNTAHTGPTQEAEEAAGVCSYNCTVDNRHSAMFPQAAAEESHTVDTATNIFILLVAVTAAVVAIAGFSVYLRYLRRTEDHDSRYLHI